MTQNNLTREEIIAALQYYFGYTLRPLVEVLRIQHNPERWFSQLMNEIG